MRSYHPEVHSFGPPRESDAPNWLRRSSLGAERRRLLDDVWPGKAEFDAAENERTRLGSGCSVELGGLVLAEAFTPSTIESLYKAIDSWDLESSEYLEQRKRDIRQWRAASGSGAWHVVSTFAKPSCSSQLGLDGVKDETLPPGIDAVHLFLASASPSVTLLIALCMPSTSEADLSDVLRADFATEVRAIRIRVPGRLGKIRARVPFARPRKAYFSTSTMHPTQIKEETLEARLELLQEHCWSWLSGTARGKFSNVPVSARPVMRVYFTDGVDPFSRTPALGPLGLDYSNQVWNTSDCTSFYFADLDWAGLSDRKIGCTAVEKRAFLRDLGESESGADSVHPGVLADLLVRQNVPMVAAWWLDRLLDQYRLDVARIRDSRPVTESPGQAARRLTTFLASDGHDIAIVAKDVEQLTMPASHFGVSMNWMVDVTEVLCPHPGRDHETPARLGHSVRERLHDSAVALSAEFDVAFKSIGSSAQLLQSMSEMKLQRLTIVLSVVAIVVAMITLLATT